MTNKIPDTSPTGLVKRMCDSDKRPAAESQKEQTDGMKMLPKDELHMVSSHSDTTTTDPVSESDESYAYSNDEDSIAVDNDHYFTPSSVDLPLDEESLSRLLDMKETSFQEQKIGLTYDELLDADETSPQTPSPPPESKWWMPSASLDTLRRSLDSLTAEYGPCDPLVARTWNLIGNAHFRARQFDQAIESYQAAIMCEFDVHIADSYANLGTVYWSMGRIQHALDFLFMAKHAYEYFSYLAGRNPSTSLEVASVRYQIGVALTLQGSYAKAVKYLLKSKRIREEQLGLYHIDVARVADALGKVHMLNENFISALRFHEEALFIKHRLAWIEGDFSITISTLTNIAIVHQLCGNTKAAITACNSSLDRQLDQLSVRGNQSLRQSLAVTLTLLGDLQSLKKQLSFAIASYRDAVLFLKAAGIQEGDERLDALKAKIVESDSARLEDIEYL